MIELIEKLANDNIYLSVDGEDLKVNFEGDQINEEIILEIKRNKPQLIEYLRKYESHTTFTAIPKLAKRDSYPISAAQRRLWILNQFEQGTSPYNIPKIFLLNGEYDLECIKKAIDAVIDRHEILRTVFRKTATGEIHQWILSREELGFEIDYLDLRESPDQQTQIDDYTRDDSSRSFDLSTGPLLRACLIQKGDTDYLFYFNMHHIISDGWSLEILSRDVMAYYQSFKNGTPLGLPPLNIQYKDFAAWELSRLEASNSDKHRQFWLEQLSGELPLIDLPTSLKRPPIKTHRGNKLTTFFSTPLTHRLKAFCQQQGGTLFMGLLSSLNVLLYKYTGKEDLVLGTALAGREHKDLENQIGFYINTLALRNSVSGQQSFAKLFQQIRHRTLNAFSHQAYPFDRLIDDLNLKRDTSRNPVFDMMAVLQNTGDQQIELDIHTEEVIDDGEWISKVDVECVFQEVKDSIIFNITYNPDVYEGQVMKRFMLHYKQLVEALLQQPDLSIGQVSYLLPEEIDRLIQLADHTQVGYPQEKTIVHLFEEQVSRTPERTALRSGDASLTYEQLNTQANQLAHYLNKQHQIEPDELVSLQLERSEWMIVAMLAVLKAGGAYLPIDPAYPEERIQYMLSDSNSKLLIDKDFLEGFHQQASTLSKENLPIQIQPNHLAYVIYTSGSTGQPKGVMVEHRNVVRLLKNEEDLFDFSEHDVWSMFHSYCFDFSVWEMYGALLFGGALVIVPLEATKDPHQYLNLLAAEKVSVLNQTPSVFYNLIKEDLSNPSSDLQLRYVIFGGEALSPGRLADWRKRHPETQLINMYGITETTVHVTYKEIKEEEIEKDQSNIGVAIPTLSSFILDQDQQLVPLGVAGELYVGGAGLARGYLNRPELSAQRFIPNPFDLKGRLYRSGDQAVLLPNGEMEYKGRIDEQVKIRGYRIELGEIEHFLASKEGIDAAIVITTGNSREEQSLAAYVVSQQAQNTADLRQFLKERLPAYMVPAYFIQIDEIPVTSNGKVDRKALPLPAQSSLSTQSSYLAPSNETEQELITIWETVLRREAIGVEDNFFELGGDSMKSIQAVVLIKKQLGKEINVGQLYTHQTIKELANWLASQETESQTDLEYQQGMALIEDFKANILQEQSSQPHLFEDYEDIYPLTAIEEGMIYSSRMRPLEPVYYDQFNYRIQIDDFDRFKSTLYYLFDRHPIFRTKYFLSSFQEPAKIVYKQVEVPFSFEDVSDHPDALKEQKIMDYVEEDIQIRLRFDNELLWRMRVFKVNPDDYMLFASFHHSMLDGWSISVLTTELTHMLTAELTSLPPLQHSYKDYCALLYGRKLSETAQSYWKDLLQGYSRNKLPFNYKGTRISEELGMKSISKLLDLSLMKKVEQVAADHKLSLKAIYLAAHTYLMHIICSEQDVVTGVVTHDRPEIENSEKILGCFLNTVPIRIDFNKVDDILSLLKQVNQYLIDVKPNEIHLAEIAQTIGEKTALTNPVFDTLFNFLDFHMYEDFGEDAPDARQVADEVENDLAYLSKEMTNTYLDIELDRTRDLYALKVKYIPAYFDDSSMRYALELYERILQLFVQDLSLPVRATHLLSAEDRQELLYDFNNTVEAYSKDKTLQQLFEEQVERTPHQIALRFKGQSLSYQNLNEASNRLAHHLIETGIKAGDNIGLLSARNFEMIIGMFAILKAGGSYVPVDPNYPIDRQEYILQNSAVSKVVIDASYSILDAMQHIDFIKIDTDQLQEYATSNPSLTIDSHQLAYTIYTSGSTGRPKGVMIEHHSAVNLIEWVNNTFEVGTDDRLLFITSMCFDLSVYDIFGMLACGGTLVIALQEEVQEVQRLKALMKEERITFWDSVPTTMNYLIEEIADEDFQQDDLRLVFMSGDWIPVQLPDRILKHFPNANVISLGGATEGTVWSNYFPIQEVGALWNSIPYGRPITNNFFYILDDQRQPVPKGVAGELFIGGVGVARGYDNEVKKTAASFFEDPFYQDAGGRMYRTGDLGRMLPSGNMEFLGRKDHQVKIRGYRVELGEIESVLQKSQLVDQAVVGVHQDSNGLNRLCAYLVAKHQPEISKIREHLKEVLPSYMIPDYYMILDAIPLNSNGKIDRRALPAPAEQEQASTSYIAPTTATEKSLATIWQKILNIKQVGVEDDFFDLGANSLQVGAFINRVHKELGSELSIREVFTQPNIKAIAGVLEQQSAGSYNEIQALAPQQSYVISDAQRRLWVLSQFEQANAAYNMPASFPLNGSYDLNSLQQAIHAVVDRHEILRTVFREDEKGEIRQWVLAKEEFNFNIHHLDLRTYADPNKEAEAYINEDAFHPFNLAEGPLLRAALLQLSDEDYIFYYNMHHIISDGISLMILSRDVLAFYEAYKAGNTPELTPLRIQYKDYAAWQQEQLNTSRSDDHRNYWLEQLNGELPLIDLPAYKKRPLLNTNRGQTFGTYLSKELTDEIKAFSQQRGGSLFMGLLSSLYALLYRYTGQEDLIIGSPVAGRDHSDLEDQIGFYINNLVLRNYLSSEETFEQFFDKVKDNTLDAYAHQMYPFDRLVEELDLKRDTGRNPLFDIVIVLQNGGQKIEEFQIEENLDEIYDYGEGVSKSDVHFSFEEFGDYLFLKVNFNTDVYDGEMIRSLMRHFKQLTHQLITHSAQAISTIDYLRAEEKQQLLQEFNAPALVLPADQTVIDLFEQQAAKSPDRIALIFDQQELSFKELNERANRLAYYLIHEQNVAVGDMIGIMLERSEWTIISMLGILKAGAAYVPIDIAYPAERKAFMVAETQLKALIIESDKLFDVLEFNTSIISIDIQFQEMKETFTTEGDKIRPSISSSNLAYVIYTSGSSGQPKGVLLEHGGLLNNTLNQIEAFQLTAESTSLQFASVGFDASVSEIFTSLLSGGRLVVPRKEDLLTTDKLSNLLERYQIDTLTLPPSYQALMVEEFAGVSTLISAGEALNRAVVADLQSRGVRVINGYGPTESTVCISMSEQPIREDGIITIGSPNRNVQIHLLSHEQQLVPIGVKGEICVGGIQLARAYLGREELTNEKFIHLSLDGQETIRLYKTGDWGRWLPDGTIEYLGREDDQVKISGYRIEPDEIRYQLLNHSSVSEAAVLVQTNSAGDQELVAYLVSKASLSDKVLKDFLSEQLPDYMIPSYYVALDSLPLTTNGKLDKKQLPKIEGFHSSTENTYVAPTDEIESQLVNIWEEVLGREKIGLRDDFFELGGNSLKATKLISRIQKEMGVDLQMDKLFRESTIELIAEDIRFIHWNESAVEEDLDEFRI